MDIAVSARSWGSAANANSYHLDAAFLDGGLHAETGNYWGARKGAWIEGEEAVTWIAHGMGLMPPASLRCKHAPTLPDDLRAAYATTDFVVLDEPEIHVEVGLPLPDGLRQRMAALQSETAAIVTAWNPFSRSLAEAENRLRQKHLLHELRGKGLDVLPAEGRDRQGQWPAEESALVIGLSRAFAEELLVRYQQHALVWMLHDAPIQLVFHTRSPSTRKPPAQSGD